MRRFLNALFGFCLGDPIGPTTQMVLDCMRRTLESVEKGEYDKAIAEQTQILAIDRKNVNSYELRGSLWFSLGEYDKAIADYTKALAIEPDNARIYDSRGFLWREKGEFDKAIVDFTRAVAIAPNKPWAYKNLGLIYASCPNAKYRDGKKAVENANKAQQLSDGKNPGILLALAAAYAESGDFAMAQEFGEKAIELVPERFEQELRGRMELYKQGKPYHEEPVKK